MTWSTLGMPGAAIPQTFSAANVQGAFSAAAGGTVAQVCPTSSCNYASAPGFNAGDFLLWSESATGTGTGPLTLTFSTPVRGAGLYLELTAPGTFTASFSEITITNTFSEFAASDSAGDPLFLGALDPSADINAIKISILFCTPSTPGACSPTDFSVDTLNLASTSVPEPSTFALAGSLLALVCLCRFTKVKHSVLALVCGTAILGAQEPIPFDPTQEQLFDATDIARQLAIQLAIQQPALQTSAATNTPTLPLWQYQVVSPVNGFSYRGYMVGTSPFNRGARSTTIPAILIPVIATFQNTSSGFNATFDPSGTADAGCTANQTVMNLVANSPLFQNNPWTLNGAYLGNTQYIDAYQRSNFWQYVQNSGNAYHTLLSYTLGAPLRIPITYAAPTNVAEVRVGIQSSCTNPASSGSTNGAGYEGIVDIATLHAAFINYIAANGITPDQFAIFVMYNVEMSQNNESTYYGGYHFTQNPYPLSLTTPGQTYAVANFRTFGTGNTDIGILSHEVAEWLDDPGGSNPAPAWGHIGQEQACSYYFEVGDPLTGTGIAPIVGANGFTYHLQELAYFSWFFRTPSIGAGGNFSDSSSFTGDAGPLCQ